MKKPYLAATVAGFLSAGLLATTAYAQSDPLKPADSAVKQAQDRLPDDAPRATATSSPGGDASPGGSAAGQPDPAEMMNMMMEMAKLNDNHKLLGELVGSWTYKVKMWMDPAAPPLESKGTATRRAEMGGRYFVAETSGNFPMPGPDGKMKDFDFKGRSTEAYDNAKKKFVSSWIDNMGTGIMLSEGTYDASTKTFTYHSAYDMAPGVQTKIRETIKIADKDHHTMEWFEDRGGQEVKTMEIAYTRKK
jgi:hypothetical protein